MKIFDVHTHVFPDKIAAQALAHLRKNFLRHTGFY